MHSVSLLEPAPFWNFCGSNEARSICWDMVISTPVSRRSQTGLGFFASFFLKDARFFADTPFCNTEHPEDIGGGAIRSIYQWSILMVLLRLGLYARNTKFEMALRCSHLHRLETFDIEGPYPPDRFPRSLQSGTPRTIVSFSGSPQTPSLCIKIESLLCFHMLIPSSHRLYNQSHRSAPSVPAPRGIVLHHRCNSKPHPRYPHPARPTAGKRPY